MALRKNEAPKQFEDAEESQSTPAADAAPAADIGGGSSNASQSTAVVTRKSTTVAAAGRFSAVRPGKLFADLKVEDPPFEFGTFPRFSGSNGQIQTQDGKLVLGRSVVLQLISYNDWWLVSPGEKSKESTDVVKYSNDGKTINDSTQSVADYLEEIKQDYPKASVKGYCSLWGLVMELGADGNCPQLVGKVVEISLAPQSKKTFNAHDTQRQIDVMQRKANPAFNEIITVTAKPETMNGNNFVKLVVTGTPDEKAEELIAALAPEVETEAA